MCLKIVKLCHHSLVFKIKITYIVEMPMFYLQRYADDINDFHTKKQNKTPKQKLKNKTKYMYSAILAMPYNMKHNCKIVGTKACII